MNYSKPQLSTLADAITAVQGGLQSKNILTLPDGRQGDFPQ